MRPLVHPALTQVWRDRTTVQIGLDPGRALVLGGLEAVESTVLRALDGTRDMPALQALAREHGGDATTAERLLGLLSEAGVVVDGEQIATASDDALAPDAASLGLATGDPDGGVRGIDRRRGHWVEVRGAGRVGAQVARLLAAAGVGRTTVIDDQQTTRADTAPGGLGRAQIGHRRGPAAQALARASSAGSSPVAPSLIVLAPPPGTLSLTASALLSDGTPHLVARITELTGVVGPLVLPGRSACMRCLELHRTDRDPAWPRIIAQADRRGRGAAACDVALATHIAALAAQQALALIDGFTPATVDGTIETTLPYGLPRRRSWHPHPACGCRWA